MCALRVKGLEKLNAELRNLTKEVDNVAMTELKKICDEILADAMARVPVDTGKLKGSGKVRKIERGYAVGFDIYYAPYVEFGSGGYTVVPAGYESFAMEFYVDGTGTSRPQPFLFPAFLARRDNIVNELEKKINELLKSK